MMTTKSKEGQRTVLKKLAKVMAAAMPVAKTGENKFQHYKYATEVDVVMAIRNELIKNKVFILPSVSQIDIQDADKTSSGSQQYLTSVNMEYTIWDIETGDSISCEFVGQGMDTGDKGVYKAITGANKYFLLKTFQIPTTDDPEGDEETDKNNPPPPQEIKWFPAKWSNGFCAACGNKHVEQGQLVAKIEGKWVAKECHEHVKAVETASPPPEESTEINFRKTLENMDRIKLEQVASDITRDKGWNIDSFDGMDKDGLIQFITEARK